LLHRFEFDGTRIVLDVHSGAVHVVDKLVWDLLDDYQQVDQGEMVDKFLDVYEPEDIIEALCEIRDLEQKGLLNSPEPFPDGYRRSGECVTKALCLHLAHSCNLRCLYCFAGQGCYGGADELMQGSTGRRAIDLLIDRSGGRKRLEIDFFGGEPLLNFKVLKELVSYARLQGQEKGKEFQFTVTTNGVLLDDEISSFLIEQDINVVLSLDGRRDVHDDMRRVPAGTGSYDMVLPRIQKFVTLREGQQRTGTAYTIIRGTYTRHNLDFCSDVLHMAGLGFKSLSIEPVVAFEDAEYSIRREDIPLLLTQYEELTRELLKRRNSGKPVNFFHFNIDFDGGPCLPKRLSGCGAGGEYLAVAPNGDIYPCHQFVGRSEYLMGSVKDGQVDPSLIETFRMAHLYNKEGCAECWAKFHCSGGCHASAEGSSGSIFIPYQVGCELARKRLECAIYLKAVELNQIEVT